MNNQSDTNSIEKAEEKTGDFRYKILIFQCGFSLVIIFAFLIFKLIGGTPYCEIKEWYHDHLLDDTRINDIFENSPEFSNFEENEYAVIVDEN